MPLPEAAHSKNSEAETIEAEATETEATTAEATEAEATDAETEAESAETEAEAAKCPTTTRGDNCKHDDHADDWNGDATMTTMTRTGGAPKLERGRGRR